MKAERIELSEDAIRRIEQISKQAEIDPQPTAALVQLMRSRANRLKLQATLFVVKPDLEAQGVARIEE